jgi:predicted RNase H-like nuclease
MATLKELEIEKAAADAAMVELDKKIAEAKKQPLRDCQTKLIEVNKLLDEVAKISKDNKLSLTWIVNDVTMTLESGLWYSDAWDSSGC